MFSSTTVADSSRGDTGTSLGRVNLPGRPDDYYGGDFVEDGSFLVLSTDGLSLSPTTPPGDGDVSDEDAKNMDIEVLNCVDEEEATSSSTCHSGTQAQVLGEDPESSVDSISKIEEQKSESLNISIRDPVTSSVTNMSLNSASSSSTDAHLIESNEEVNLLMAENKKLAELLADSNEKMKQCITTTEKLKTDHEEYKKKHEASRDVINQLRQDNDLLKSQVSVIQNSIVDNDGNPQKEIQRQSNEILELTEQLKTVLSVNGKLNDDLRLFKNSNEELRAELERLHAEKSESESKFDVLKAEIDTGRQTIAKFNEHRMRNETELAKMRYELVGAAERVQRMEAVIEEKTKLTESLRRNMEDTVTALERCNLKLNHKEEEVSLLTTQIAAINAESDNSERLEVLEMQCQTYLSDFEKEREEREKLAAEKEELLKQLNLTNRELKIQSDALEVYRRQYGSTEARQAESASRNDNAADNSNESLSSPLTSLPSVAGQFASFVRRELLGWEDLGASSVDTNQGGVRGVGGETGSSETVVQQPQQQGIPPCPICRKTFSSLERLQTHASNCGDLDRFGGRPEDNSFVFP